MDQIWFVDPFSKIFVLLLLFYFSSKIISSRRKHQKKQLSLPPSPPSLPIIGHLYLYLLKKPFHQTLQHLSTKYGPLIYLKFGCLPFVVISSPELVKECFYTKLDITLANRSSSLRMGSLFHYNYKSYGAAPYGPFWRNLRKVVNEELFSSARQNLLFHIREEEMHSMIKSIHESCQNSSNSDGFAVINVRPRIFQMTFNILMRMLTGKRYFFGDGTEVIEENDKLVYGIIKDVFELSGSLSNPSDFFPYLRWFNLGNIEGRMLECRDKMDKFLNGLMEECKKIRKEADYVSSGKDRALIFKLLDLQELDPDTYTDEVIKANIIMLLQAGTDTSSLSTEWALAALLKNPMVMLKARLEISNQIGENRLVNESDLPNLRWVKNITAESLRMFPSGPLLVPHEASEDCVIAGHRVEKGTMLLVNAWAIHRDPKVWDEPMSFKPERFEGFGGAMSEQYRLRFVPFGHGRRSCPGNALATKVLELTLAVLIQCFDWGKVNEDEIDLSEGAGITMPMAKPLQALCKTRNGMINVLSKM